MPGKRKQHTSSLDADQTHDRTEDHAASHLGSTSGAHEKKLEAGKKVKESSLSSKTTDTRRRVNTTAAEKNISVKFVTDVLSTPHV